MPSQGNSLVIDDHFFIFVAVLWYIQYALFIFRPCANYGVPCIITSICWTSHRIISANVIHRHCCYLWYVNKIITHFFNVSVFFFWLAKIKVPCESFRFCWLFMLLSNSVMRIYGTKKLIHRISSSVFAGFCVGCNFLSPYNNPRMSWPDLPIGEVNWTLQVHVSLSIASLNLQH